MNAYVDFIEARTRLLERLGALIDSGELSMDNVVDEVDATKSVIGQIAFIRMMSQPPRPAVRPVLRLVKS
jgi:hypothetical protein